MSFSGLWIGKPLTRPYGRRKNGNCSCNTEWCTEHNDCSWECHNVHIGTMTVEEFNRARGHIFDIEEEL